MIQRLFTPFVKEFLDRFPVVVLHGARQTGKTTLAGIIRESNPEAQYLNFERVSDLRLFANPEKYLQKFSKVLVIIDNFQRHTPVFESLYTYTKDQKAGSLLVFTTESLDDIPVFHQGCEERKIGYLQIPPFIPQELVQNNITFEQHWVRGSFPGSLFATTDGQSLTWREEYIAAALERQTPILGLVVSPYQLRLFWLALVQEHGKVWNASGIARFAGFSPPTALAYRQLLEKKMIVRVLPAFPVFTHKRIMQKPVMYIRDSGLLHAALKLQDRNAVFARTDLSASWRGYVIEQILNTLAATGRQNTFTYWHYRTHDGAECDLVIAKANTPVLCVHAQWSTMPRLPKKFALALQDVSASRNVIVVPSHDGAFPIAPSVYVMTLTELLSAVLPLLYSEGWAAIAPTKTPALP